MFTKQRWLSITEMVEYANISKPTIRQLIAEGKIKAKAPSKKKILVDRLSFDSYMEREELNPVQIEVDRLYQDFQNRLTKRHA